MERLKTAAWLGAAAALLGGCAPMATPYNYPQSAPYTMSPAEVPYYGKLPIYTDNFRPNGGGGRIYRASYQSYPQRMQARPMYSQQFEPSDAPARRALLMQARQALGVRYTFGGTSPSSGFDCSGLTQYVYKNANGITLPRTAAEQSRASRTIRFNEIRPGDLIFFRTSGRDVNHVGVYVGRGQFIHAASGGAKVSLDTLSKSYWQQRLVKFGRILA